MTIHSDCGKEIKWVHRDDDPDRWHPPLEFAGQAYVIIDEVAVYTSIYQRHECDPDDMKKWLELKRAQAEIKGVPVEDIDRREERAIARKLQQDEEYAVACRVACIVCKAEKGELCFNLHKLKKGDKIYNLHPHLDRHDRGWADMRREKANASSV